MFLVTLFHSLAVKQNPKRKKRKNERKRKKMMSDPIQLEKMGRELKCPICLSLLTSAVSLTCNHVFCNSCIVKSMKSGSDCPVCKVPFSRREVRPAPHMDNLVSIYRSMEVASGFNIFVTQNAPSTKLSDKQKKVEGDKNWGNDDIGEGFRDKMENQQRLKRKGSRKSINLEDSGTVAEKPSFPAKKRVQVPQYPIPKSSMPSKRLGTDEIVKDGYRNSSVAVLKKDYVSIEKGGESGLSPFFWLRDEEAENLSQTADVDDLLEVTPPNVLTFSDMKDSGDENPSKSSPYDGVSRRSNAADIFDSEMFEWTQRACSPELFSSPVKMQDEASDEIEESISEAPSGSADINEGNNIENEKGMGNSGEINHVVSSMRTKRANNRVDYNKSNKRVKNAMKVGTIKRGKKNSKMESGKIIQKEAVHHKGSSLNLEKTGKRSKKVDYGNSATVTKPKIVSSVPTGDTHNPGDKYMIPESSGSFRKKKCSKEDPKMKSGKRSRKVRSQSPQERSLRSKKLKLESSEVNQSEVHTIQEKMNKDANPQVSLLSSPVIHDKDILDVQERSKHGQEVKSSMTSAHKKELRSKKNTKGSFNGISLVNKCQGGHSNISTVEVPTMGAVTNVLSKNTESLDQVSRTLKTKLLDNPVTLREESQENGAALRKCKTAAVKVQCAFCLSSEDSEASGEMMHYYNGRPVTANYNDGSKMIHSHRNCVEWAPNVYFEDDTAVNLEAELTRSRRIRCCCCGLKGAALGCYEKSCRKSFHVSCAKLIPQCRWDNDNFVMLCPLHVSSKLPNEQSLLPSRQVKKCVSKRQCSNQCNQFVPNCNISSSKKWKPCATTSKRVLCCSALTIGEKEVVSEFERVSGVTVMKIWDSSVSHVISSTDENGACKRTLKILMGILEGKWILNLEWVKACIKAMEFVAEEPYEVNVDIHGIRDGPQLGRLRLLNKQPRLFEGMKFYFSGDFVPSYKGYIRDLLTSGGGSILHRKPIPEAQGKKTSGRTTPSTFVIYSLELPDKCDASKKDMILNRRRSEAEALASSTGSKAVSNAWILNSIAACSLQFAASC